MDRRKRAVSSGALDDVSILCCSYNERTVLHRMLQSFAYHHPGTRFRTLIVENSHGDEIADFLKRHDVPYWRNDSGDTRHAPSIDLGLARVRTRYVLLCDSDIVIRRPIDRLLRMLIDAAVDVAGVPQGARGGYILRPRISPHFCLVNVDRIRNHGIAFHDQARVDRTASHGFFEHVPIQPNDGQAHYDCGGTFFEDCVKKDLRVVPVSGLDRYVFHAESLSWSRDPDPQLWTRRLATFMEESAAYRDVDLGGRFDG
jgi:glycosyl transferase family 2